MNHPPGDKSLESLYGVVEPRPYQVRCPSCGYHEMCPFCREDKNVRLARERAEALKVATLENIAEVKANMNTFGNWLVLKTAKALNKIGIPCYVRCALCGGHKDPMTLRAMRLHTRLMHPTYDGDKAPFWL
jgi:hypothetical protein